MPCGCYATCKATSLWQLALVTASQWKVSTMQRKVCVTFSCQYTTNCWVRAAVTMVLQYSRKFLLVQSFYIIDQNTLRINLNFTWSTAHAAGRARTFNGRPIRTCPFANIPHADKRSHSGLIKDGIFLSGSNGERLPHLQRHLDCCCWVSLQKRDWQHVWSFSWGSDERWY